MKGHGNGAKDVGRRALKIGSKRSKNQQHGGTFFGFDSQGGGGVPSPLPLLLHLPAPRADLGGGRTGAHSSDLSADCLYIIWVTGVWIRHA